MEKAYRILAIIFVVLFVGAMAILFIVGSKAAMTHTLGSLPFVIVLALLLYGASSILVGLFKRSQVSLRDSLPQWYKQAEIRRGILAECIALIVLIVVLVLLH